MSTTIDERVVEMRFDNKEFEKNVQTSISTLGELKESLDLDGAAKGLDGLGAAAKKCDLSTLSNSVETVRVKFSALEIMAKRALENITDSAMRTGKQLLSSLTVDQISAGWEKFGDKTTSVGTLVSQGYDIETVNDQLERLNWFTDETSYNFTDMVSNIAKFTASGQDLQTSVTALEGIANWAALSGQNAQTASNAMYQLSQAMGSGIMRKEDYKSIQNASMDTDEFRQKALDAGVALGTLKKNIDGTYTSLVAANGSFTKSQFADHLTKDAWFTSDVMMKVFNDYSAAVDQIYAYADEKGITASQAIEELGDEVDQFGLKAFKAAQEARTFPDVIDSVKDAVSTGWMNTFELIFGNYEEAKELWTNLANAMYDVFAEGGNARNEMLEEALSYSGWNKFTGAIEEAGIQVDTFEGKLRESSDASGKSLAEIIDEAGSLEDAVQQGLISTDTLLNAVKESADGLTEEQMTALNQSLDELIDGVGELSGRQHLIAAFWDAWEGIVALLSAVKEAFRDIFPATTSEQVFNFTKGLHELTSRFRYFVTESEEGLEVMSNLKSTFKGFFAVLDIVKQAAEAVWNALRPLFGGVGTLSSGILGLTGSFGDWLVALDETIKEGDVFNGAIQKMIGFIMTAAEKIGQFIDRVKQTDVFQKISKFASDAAEKIREFVDVLKTKIKPAGFEALSALLERLKIRIGQFIDVLSDMGGGVGIAFAAIGEAIDKSKPLAAMQKLYSGIKTVLGSILSAFGKLASGIVEKLSNADFSGAIDLLNGVSFGAIALGISKFLKNITSSFDEVGGILENAKSVLDGVRGCFEAYQTQLKAGALLKIAGAIAILAASIVAISLIDSEKLNASLGAITMLFVELMTSMAIFSKISGNMKGVTKSMAAMLTMSTSVLILASALKKIADLDPAQLAVGLTGVTVMLGELVAVMKLLGTGSSKAIKGAGQMILFAAAIKILAGVAKDLAELDLGSLTKGLVGVGVLLAEVAGFLKLAKMDNKSIATATGIVILASAMKILASACKDFAAMNVGELAKGIGSIGVLLAELAGFTKLTGNAKNVIATGLALIEIAAAMKIFASAVGDFGSLSLGELAKGLVAMGVALAEVTAAVNLMPKNMVSMGLGLIAVGAALEIVADVLGKLGNMSVAEIAKSLVTMGVALGELAIGLKAMNGSLAGSAALLVAAGALGMLTPVLLVLGTMSVGAIAKSLITLAGAFTVLGVAGAVLAPLAPTILTLSASLALVGVGTAAIGAGLLAAGAGLSAIAVGITALATSLGGGVAIIVAGLTTIITGIAALIPAIAEKIGEAVVAFCKVIADSAPAIGEAIKAVVLTLIDVFVECVPALANGVLELIAGVLAALVTYTPQIVDSIMQFLIELLEGIARNLPTLIKAAVDVLVSFFSGIVDALASIDTDSLIKTIVGIGLLSGIMVALSAVAGLVPGAMVGLLGVGAIIAEMALVLAAVGALAQIPGLNWLINEGGKLLGSIGTAIGSLVGGIVGGFMSGVSSQFPQIAADLSAFMENVQPFINGASSISPSMLDGVKALTEAVVLLTGAELLQGLTSWLTGGSSLSSFAEQLVPFGEAMTGFSNAISGMDADLVTQAANAGLALAELTRTLPKSGGLAGFFSGESDMESFGEQIVVFGEAMCNFAASVRGMDADAVINAATAGKAMAELATTLPNSGGVVGFFAGENDMEDFASQLVPFGEAMKEYSLAVQGLDVDAITNSAAAGQVMVDLANTLPNCGGVVGFFTGENDLDIFGEQLLSFGYSIRDYSMAVQGLDGNAIQNSATAGRALVELADTIPNCGGLVSFFTGDNNIGDFGDDLVLFGEDLAAYADAVKDMNPTIVTASINAAKALSGLAEGLPDSSLFDRWFGGDQTLSDFGDELADFGEAMGDFYDEMSDVDSGKLEGVVQQVLALADLAEHVQTLDKNALANFSDALTTLADSGIESFTDAFYDCGTEVKTAVIFMLNTVGTAIDQNEASVTDEMTDLMSGLADIVDEQSASINTAVIGMMVGFAGAIRENGTSVRTAMRVVMIAVVNEVNDYKSQFNTAGVNVAQGFINGINSKLSGASSAGRALGLAALNAAKKALDSHSPSREFIHLGENIGEGLAIGVNNSIVPASQATSKMVGEVIAESNKGIDAFKKYVEEKKYYSELSLKDELAGWENLQKKYKENSEERIQIDREVYRVQNELVAATYQASLDWIEEQKYYNKLTLAEELAAYKRMQGRYMQGSEQRKKIDREIYTLEKEISDAQKQYIEDVQQVQRNANQQRLDLEEEYADKVRSINEQLASDIEAENQRYEDALESRENALYKSYGLFDAVKERDEVSGDTLMKNLEGQVKEFGEWQDILESLSSRGVDSELLEELQEMGPDAIAQVKALNEMSDDELEKYVSLWFIKHAQAREQAVGELEGLREETQQNIVKLREQADEELSEYCALWHERMNQVTEDANAELEELRKAFEEKVGLIKNDTEAELEEMSETAQKILTEAGWDETGKQIVTGLTEGVQSERSSFIDELTSMALAGVEAVKSTLDINSPSRVFRELGNYTGLGFVQGLHDYVSRSYDAGTEVAEGAEDGLSYILRTIADLINGGFDMEPTITPVLDLSNISTGAAMLDDILGSQRAFGLVGQASRAFATQDDSREMTLTVDNDDVVSELRSLRGEMASMLDRMERLRVVLNTGTLVGELVEPMDAALGQKATQRGRGM